MKKTYKTPCKKIIDQRTRFIAEYNRTERGGDVGGLTAEKLRELEQLELPSPAK